MAREVLINIFVFSGHCGQNAELRTTKGGTELAQFSVAVKAGYGQNESTVWVRCAMFGKRAQSLAPYLVKGQQVVVSGEASLNSWTNKDGIEKTSLEVRVNDVTLVGGRPEGAEQPVQQQAPAIADDWEESDIPF